jgi:hypothetical protein
VHEDNPDVINDIDEIGIGLLPVQDDRAKRFINAVRKLIENSFKHYSGGRAAVLRYHSGLTQIADQ